MCPWHIACPTDGPGPGLQESTSSQLLAAAPTGKTDREIQELLGSAGARRVMTDYEDSEVVAISFSILIRDKGTASRSAALYGPIGW